MNNLTEIFISNKREDISPMEAVAYEDQGIDHKMPCF
jgi:hypothetical protein